MCLALQRCETHTIANTDTKTFSDSQAEAIANGNSQTHSCSDTDSQTVWKE
jgi:hypothetical protein